jgi:5'-3' exonuclease
MQVHLVDGTFELYRAHFAPRPAFTDRAGRDAKATLGVVQSMLQLLSEKAEAVTHVAVAFDNPIVSFRNALFPGYKSDDGVPEVLRSQFDAVEAAVAALGIVVWRCGDFEADDALASFAARSLKDERVTQVRLLTPDKDLAQCLVKDRVVQVDRIRKKVRTEATLLDEWGLRPAQVPDYLALVGDTADGIPGIDGWGDKSAVAILQARGSLEAIGDDPSSWGIAVRGAERLAAALRAGRAQAALYKQLATLRVDVPLPNDVDGLAFRGTPRDRWFEWCDGLGVSESVRHRPTRFA